MKYPNLESLTGKESGIVIHGENFIICNWSHGDGIPYIDPTGRIIMMQSNISFDGAAEQIEDIIGYLDEHNCIYDANNDLDGLAGHAGLLYRLGDELSIIAPEAW